MYIRELRKMLSNNYITRPNCSKVTVNVQSCALSHDKLIETFLTVCCFQNCVYKVRNDSFSFSGALSSYSNRFMVLEWAETIGNIDMCYSIKHRKLTPL